MFNNEKQFRQAIPAFSFIEVILVVAIIGIMTSIVFTSINQSKHRTELETAANEVVASIRKIQNYSLSGKDISSTCSEYRFIATINSNTFTIDNGGSTCPFSENYQLKSGVVFGSNIALGFNAPFGNRTNNNAVDIIVKKGSNNYHICVTGVGVITMQNNAC